MDLTDSELSKIADDIGVDKAALQSDAVKNCAESVKADNPDMDTSAAFAICQDMENQGLLAEPSHVALAEQRQPGTIERTEQDDGSVRYANIELLAPGVWGDAASQRQFLYSERTIQALADNIIDTTLNLFHEQDNETTNVGYLDDSSVYVGDDDGGLFGDIVLTMDNAASEFTDEALQDALESRGQKGLKGPSLEIARPDHEFNADAGVPEVTDGVITGVGLVGLGVSLGPGSKDVAFDKQTQQRAVALSSADTSHVLYRTDDMTETDKLLGALSEQLSEEELREVAAERGIELQIDGEAGMAMDLIEQAMNEGFDPGDQSVDELMAYIGENLDPSEDAMDALSNMAETMLDESDAESLDDVAAGDLMNYIRESSSEDDGQDGEEGEEEPEEPEGDDVEMSEQLQSLQEQVQANAERIESLAEATENVDLGEIAEQVAHLSDAMETKADAERVSDLSETVETVADTLQEPTSLASMGGDESGDDTVGTYVDFGHSEVDKTY